MRNLLFQSQEIIIYGEKLHIKFIPFHKTWIVKDKTKTVSKKLSVKSRPSDTNKVKNKLYFYSLLVCFTVILAFV